MTIPITYHFKFPKEGGKKDLTFKCSLDENLFFEPGTPLPSPLPEWTKLSFKQCSHCPLKEGNVPHCPIAESLSVIVEFFKDTPSHERCRVFVETSERAYAKECAVQDGLFSIFGLIMATSGCPHMNFFKKMARFHLPFGTPTETLYRATAHYLLEDYLKNQKEKREFPPSLEGLKEIYKNVEILNSEFIQRLRAITKKDADLNAVVILNCFGQMIMSEISQDFSQLYEIFMI